MKDIDVFRNAKWSSVYNLNGNEPIYTTKTGNFVGTLDYLFYRGNTQVLSYLEMPFSNDMHKKEFGVETDKECAQKFEYFPNENYSSDHIALCADLKLS